MNEENCIFCKIIKGEIPCTKIYEDEMVLAFLDIAPVAYGHTLVIPKTHHAWMQECPNEIISHAFITSKKIMNAMKKGLGAEFVQVDVTGRDVLHFHIHLIPKMMTDSIEFKKVPPYTEGQAKEYADKIIGKLS